MENKLKPDNPGRTKGALETLIAINYQTISDWSGLSVSTVRQYASRGQFDSRNLESVLTWCNVRRKASGLPNIGQTTDNEDNTTVSQSFPLQTPQVITGGYNPMKGDFNG